MSEVKTTKQYDKFRFMEGNREVDRRHTKTLKQLFERNGNLIKQFPIIVNKSMEVIDGQHRLTVLRELDWPVAYRVHDNMTLNDVRAINLGHRNWTWLDYAKSFVARGNTNYIRFLKLYEEFGVQFHILIRYLGVGNKSGEKYRRGDLILTNNHYEEIRIWLAMWRDIADRLPKTERNQAYAFKDILQSENYEHKRMCDKIEAHPKAFDKCRTVEDYKRAFEAVFNSYAKQPVRLF